MTYKVLIVPRDIIQLKAAHGEPCTGCGVCCMAEICPLGAWVFHNERNSHAALPGPCPGLEPASPGEFRCGLMVNPEQYAPVLTAVHGAEAMREAAGFLIDAGAGCDARMRGEPANMVFELDIIRRQAINRARIIDAKRKWGVDW